MIGVGLHGLRQQECAASSRPELTIDESDDLSVKEFTWYTENGYWRRTLDNMPISHFLMGVPPEGYTWDHADMNKNNNSRSNLRLATASQQQANTKKYRGKYSSKYKGVCWYSSKGKWQATITVDYKTKHLGRFESEEEAAKAYDEAAKEYFGEFARTNF